MYFACKGKCDRRMEAYCWAEFRKPTGWKDLSDLAIPTEFLMHIMSTLKWLKQGEKYTDNAFKKEKHLIMALSQKIFREMTERDFDRVRVLISLLPF